MWAKTKCPPKGRSLAAPLEAEISPRGGALHFEADYAISAVLSVGLLLEEGVTLIIC